MANYQTKRNAGATPSGEKVDTSTYLGGIASGGSPVKNNGQEVIILCNMEPSNDRCRWQEEGVRRVVPQPIENERIATFEMSGCKRTYDYDGKKIKPVQKSVTIPDAVIPSIWISEQARVFENEVKARRTEPMPMGLFIYLHHDKFKLKAFSTEQEKIVQKLGLLDVKEITPQMLEEFHRQIAEENSMKFTAREHLHRVLCEMFKIATELGYITVNPTFRTFRYEKKQLGKHEAIDADTLKKLVQCLESESPKHRVFYSLLIETGMGRAKCANLKWEEIANLKLSQKLKRQLNRMKKDDGYVFAQPNGKAMLPSSFTYRLKLICKKHGLQGVTMRAIQNTVRGYGNGEHTQKG